MNYKIIFKDETQPLAQRRLAFLNDTVEYYSDVSRRNVVNKISCFYNKERKTHWSSANGM